MKETSIDDVRAVLEWRDRQIEQRENEDGVSRQRLRYVLDELPRKMKTPRKERSVVVAAVLESGDEGELLGIYYVGDDSASWRIEPGLIEFSDTPIKIDSSGRFAFGIYTGAFINVAWIRYKSGKDFQIPLHSIDGRETETLRIPRSSIVSDADLAIRYPPLLHWPY